MIEAVLAFAPAFLAAFLVNLEIAAAAMLIGLVLGGILATASSQVRWLRAPVTILVQLLFCLPGYVVMFFVANMLASSSVLVVVLAQAVFTTAYCSTIAGQALSDLARQDRVRAALFIPNAIRGFTITTMSSGLAAAVGIPEAVGVTMHRAERLPAFGDRIVLFLCVIAFFALFFGCVRYASARVTRVLSRRFSSASRAVRRRRRGLGRKRRGISLQASIVTSFVTVLLLFCGGITWYSYRQNSQLVLQYADQFLTDSSSATIENTDHLLSPVAAALEEIAVLGALHPDQLRTPDVQRHLLQVMLSYSGVTSVFIGFQDGGDYTQVQRLPPNALLTGPHKKALAPGSQFFLRTLTHNAGGGIDSYRFISSWGHETGEDDADDVDYDPRQQPFYTGAVASHGRSLTDVYLFPGNGQPGLTISVPIYDDGGALLGVIGADITLDKLSEFLRRQRIGKTGVAFIADDQDQIISYPDTDKNMRQTGKGVSLAKVGEFGIPAITDAFAQHRTEAASRFIYRSQGADYLASYQAFPEVFGKKWSIVIVVPVNDFVGSLKTSSTYTLLAAALMAFLAIVVADILGRRIGRSIIGLTKEAKEIRAFRLEGPIVIDSRITEIAQLVDAMAAMKGAIYAFSRYVPRGLVQQLLETGRASELGGQSRRLTMMFTDLENFSHISESLPPRQLMLLVSEHLDLVTKLVLSNTGTVDKFIGDSVMAFWGAPLPQDDHAYNACVAALQVQQAMDSMNASLAMRDQPGLATRIGLHTDEVIVGNIGSSEQMSYTVMGDGVNVASRLEGVNKFYRTRILISDAVLQEAGAARLVSRPLDCVTVKGRKGGVNIHELLAISEPGSPISASADDRRLSDLATRAFAAYQERDWPQAIRLYEQIQAWKPGDYPSALLIARCRALIDAAPTNWSGSFELLEK